MDLNADIVTFTEGGNTVHTGDTFGIGTHTIMASATDVHGNTASETFTLTVQDKTSPTLTPVANHTDEATGPNGAAAAFAATASDIVDGSDPVVFTEGATVVHSGDTFGFGTHTITASATDQHGNSASETFTVTVQDTTAPALTPVANQTDEATGPNGAAATFPASASDIVDGSDPVTFTEGDTVVHSGDTFGFGTHTITATATDQDGNSASETFTITVAGHYGSGSDAGVQPDRRGDGPERGGGHFRGKRERHRGRQRSGDLHRRRQSSCIRATSSASARTPSRQARPTSMATPPARPSPSRCRTRRPRP